MSPTLVLYEQTKQEDQSVQSTGFHMLEIHSPSLGFSIGMFVFIVVILIAVYYCYKVRRLRGMGATPNNANNNINNANNDNNVINMPELAQFRQAIQHQHQHPICCAQQQAIGHDTRLANVHVPRSRFFLEDDRQQDINLSERSANYNRYASRNEDSATNVRMQTQPTTGRRDDEY
jgi:hypothetical protein